MGLPVDAVIAGYVYQDRAHFLLYVLLASAGSALGSALIYLIGYAGGEAVLRKRISAAKYEKIHASFEKHEFWALMFPAMLPPPFPFKLFVLAAAIFEMNFGHFLLAIFAGRFLRFLTLALLTIKFGPQVVHFAGKMFLERFRWVAVAVLIALVLWLWLRRNRRRAQDFT